MDAPATAGVLRFFRDLPDPRAPNVVHRLHDILVVALCAVICGADGWAEVEAFGRSKLAWFKTFLDLPGGIPSHDTFGRVFARLDPDAFERRFVAWTSAVAGASGGRLVAVDGKSIRRSFEHAWDRSGMAHLVSAYADANRMVFAQAAVPDKSNELEAIPRLLGLLDLAGATLPRGPAADPHGPRGGELLPPVSAGPEPAQAGPDGQARRPRQTPQGRLGRALPAPAPDGVITCDRPAPNPTRPPFDALPPGG